MKKNIQAVHDKVGHMAEGPSLRETELPFLIPFIERLQTQVKEFWK